MGVLVLLFSRTIVFHATGPHACLAGLNRLWSQVKAERASLWGIIYTLYQEEPDQVRGW